MKNQHRKLVLRGEIIRALHQGQLQAAQGGYPKTGDPGATYAGCPIISGVMSNCQTGNGCNSLACTGGH